MLFNNLGLCEICGSETRKIPLGIVYSLETIDSVLRFPYAIEILVGCVKCSFAKIMRNSK